MGPRRRVACLYVGGGFAGLGRESAEARFGALAEACLRLSPQVAVREGVAVFVEISKCGRLYTEAGARARLLALAQRFQAREARVALGWDAATALAAARYGLTEADRVGELPLEALESVASPFGASSAVAGRQTPDQEVEKRVAGLIRSLRVLGLKNLSDFARLPRASLGTRFGAIAVRLSERLSPEGAPSQAWPGLRLAEKVSEEAAVMAGEVQGLWMSLESLLFLLRGLVDRAMARLRGHGERATRVRVELQLENGPAAPAAPGGAPAWRRAWEIEFPLPQGSASGLIPILRERLGFELLRDPLAAPVDRVRFEVSETVPGLGAQRDFWRKDAEERERLDGLLARLSEKLGGRSSRRSPASSPRRGGEAGLKPVFQAEPRERYLPEKAWVRSLTDGAPGKVARATEGSSPPGSGLPKPLRPLRLLPQPKRLAPVPSPRRGLSEPQARGLREPESGRCWQVRSWDGPERIETEWWSTGQGSVSRDYYSVETVEGERLWVYLIQDDAARRVFLHGYFD